jgi:5-methylcytosine-specific restriction enzyme B
MGMVDIKLVYESQFLPARDPAWLSTYSDAVRTAQEIDEAAFRQPEYQKQLWELEGVAGIGPGSSVTVPGAYKDPEIVDALWQLRNWNPPPDVRLRAKELDEKFSQILSLVWPRHNARRPSARLVRIFAVLRPREVLCLMDQRRTVQFRQWLGRPSLSLGLIGQHAISRQALREALGAEHDLEELVSYSQFAWFVWQQISASENDSQTTETFERKATDSPKLAILPARMQRKGMFYVANNLQLLMSIVRAAENGMEKDDLAQQISEEAPNLNRNSRNNVLAQAVAIGLLSVQNGTYQPTAIGRGLLEGEPPSDMLTPAFVRTVFGFALLLDDIRQEPRITRGKLAEAAQTYYPRWTTEFAPNALVAWLRDLGLVSVEGAGRTARISLTETGEYWASGLPSDLRSPEYLVVADEVSPEDVVLDDSASFLGRVSLRTSSIEDVLARFQANPNLRNYVFSTDQVRLVYAALNLDGGKRFILLAGLSGTGKTSMARAFATAYCEALGLPVDTHYLQVAVWPDWTDPSGLLGFINPLGDPPTFHETSALRFLLSADRNPDKPYFLCLDEMNLARVEHYFAPFLSAMEDTNGRLELHAGDNSVDGIPATILWPRNLFIIGTVNMDETTHPFSDKVLDRAFTFEFWDVDLNSWREKIATSTDRDVLGHVFPVLAELYAALYPARRHFGYRTCDEVLGFCLARAGLDIRQALDAVVLAKVLPKMRGDSEGAFPQALQEAAEVCAKYQLAASEKKLADMQAGLVGLGAVRFWS